MLGKLWKHSSGPRSWRVVWRSWNSKSSWRTSLALFRYRQFLPQEYQKQAVAILNRQNFPEWQILKFWSNFWSPISDRELRWESWETIDWRCTHRSLMGDDSIWDFRLSWPSGSMMALGRLPARDPLSDRTFISLESPHVFFRKSELKVLLSGEKTGAFGASG